MFLLSGDDGDAERVGPGGSTGSLSVGAIVGIVCGVFGFYVGVMSGSVSNIYWSLPLVTGGCGLHVHVQHVYITICTELATHPHVSLLLTHSLLLTLFRNMHSSTSGPLFLPCRAVWLSCGVDDSWCDHINSTVPHRYCSADCNLLLLSWEQL